MEEDGVGVGMTHCQRIKEGRAKVLKQQQCNDVNDEADTNNDEDNTD